jgi:hypothetical protein
MNVIDKDLTRISPTNFSEFHRSNILVPLSYQATSWMM